MHDQKDAFALPEKLGKPTLIEAVFEVRFEPTIPNAGDILPGMLFQELKDSYPEVQPLPLMNVPRQVRQSDPNLKFQTLHKLKGANGQVSVGDNVFAVSFAPYPGWSVARESVTKALNALHSTGFVRKTLRLANRNINIIPAELGKQLGMLDLEITFAGQKPDEQSFSTRMELDAFGHHHIVRIVTNAAGNMSGSSQQVKGLLVDVDTHFNGPFASNWLDHTTLDEVHKASKKLFFKALTARTMESLEPTWSTS